MDMTINLINRGMQTMHILIHIIYKTTILLLYHVRFTQQCAFVSHIASWILIKFIIIQIRQNHKFITLIITTKILI